MIKGITEDILKRVYDFSEMTNEELRCKFFQKLQECIELCNNTSDIIEWLKNEGLEKEVNDLLTIWKDDGTLEKLINLSKLDNMKSEIITQLTQKIDENKIQLTQKIDENNIQLSQKIETNRNEVNLKIEELDSEVDKIPPNYNLLGTIKDNEFIEINNKKIYRNKKEDLVKNLTLSNLEFKLKNVTRLVDLQPENMVYFKEEFNCDNSYYWTLTNSNLSKTLKDGTLELSASNPPQWGGIIFKNVKLHVPCLTLSAKYVSGGQYYSLGIAKDESNMIYASYDKHMKKVTIEKNKNGSTSVVNFTNSITLNDNTELLFTICGNVVSMVENNNGQLKVLCSGLIKEHFNLKRKDVLETFHPFVGGGLGEDLTTPVIIKEVKLGLYGGSGSRDFNVIKHKNGEPYIKNNKVYLTSTDGGIIKNGLNHNGIDTCSMNVITMDLTTYHFERIAKIIVTDRNYYYLHHAGNIIVDEENNTTEFFVSTWGSFVDSGGVDIVYKKLNGINFNGLLILDNPTTLQLSSNSSYDPDVIVKDGQYVIAFIETSTKTTTDGTWKFYPCIATSTTLNDFIITKTNLRNDQIEGCKIVKLNNIDYMIACNKNNYRIHNLNCEYITNLNAELVETPNYIPHPTIVQHYNGEKTKYIMIGFDGVMMEGMNDSRGNIIIHESGEYEGSEFKF